MRSNRVLENTSKIVDESANGNRLVAQASGRCLGDDGITDWADGDHVHESRNDQQNADSELRLSAARPAKATNGQETEEHESHARHVNGGAAKVREEEPTDNSANDVAR